MTEATIQRAGKNCTQPIAGSGASSIHYRMGNCSAFERTLAYNARMVDAVNQHGFILVDVFQADVSELAETCLSTLGFDKQWDSS